MQTKLSYLKSGFYRLSIILCLAIMPTLQSCYTIRIRPVDAVAEQTRNDRTDFYRDKNVREFKKNVANVPTVFNDAEIVDKYDQAGDGYYSVEYKVSLGMVLLNIITFGAVKRANVKVVSTKKKNN